MTIANEAHPLIAQYEQRLCDCLSGLVTNDQKKLIVDETIFLLETASNERFLLGESLDEAVRNAIYELGDARSIACHHTQGFFELDRSESFIVRILGRSNAVAFGAVGCADVLFMLLLQLRNFFPACGPIGLKVSPAQIRAILPRPLPFPELSLSFAFGVIYPIIAPILAGWFVGSVIPVRAHEAVYRVTMPIIVISFLVGSTMLPNTEGILCAVIQAVFWLPVGCLCAHLSSLHSRKKRLRTYQY